MDLYLSIGDYLLQKLFKIITIFLSSFANRLLLAVSLLPLYAFVKLIPLLPAAIIRSFMLPWKHGWSSLISASDSYRSLEKERAAAQMNGEFRFSGKELLPRGEARGSISSLVWSPHMETFELEGVQVSVVHEQPGKGQARSGKKILLLHGNPSWSFMWRNVIEHLLDNGHEVFALDWIGHGGSDKPVSAPLISFELHMRTLISCIEHFDLRGCYIAAHDWGGCVALCTIPNLPTGTCAGLFLLNSFFPPRPSDISLFYYLLYLIWFFSTGVFGGYLPESMVMRYMCPEATRDIIAGYCAPYTAGIHSKVSVGRFAHIVPGIPDVLLKLREGTAWRIAEGLLGPENFTNVNAQAFLAQRNVEVRQWWASGGSQHENVTPRVSVAFGRDDPLLKDFKNLLDETLRLKVSGQRSSGTWISDAGHYPVEEKPEAVARLIQQFMEKDEV